MFWGHESKESVWFLNAELVVARILVGGASCNRQCFPAQTLNQRFYYETMFGNSPGGSHRDNIRRSVARKSGGGFLRRRNAHQFRGRFQRAIKAVRFLGDSRIIRSRLAPDARRRWLAALQQWILGVDVRGLVLAKQ